MPLSHTLAILHAAAMGHVSLRLTPSGAVLSDVSPSFGLWAVAARAGAGRRAKGESA